MAVGKDGSTCWLLDHILTHEAAKVTCVDPFQGSAEHRRFDADYVQSLEARFDANIAKTGAAQKVQKQVGTSQEKLRSLPLNAYDLLYIDGSHIASDVLEDALLGWRLVKAGGLIIFDDYGFSFDQNTQHNPKAGIDAFLTIFRDKIKITHKSYQVFVEKLTDPA
ncbi:MAG: class I SAM-dependent methyltransferase [Leptolyngbyaceae cyanobacterium SM1_4_3]|nr:class I SAM-dependent methyltransferase [Leptolyngbyaceae cyanobacterium SM1_4_3]